MGAKIEPGHHAEFKRNSGRHAGKWVARFWFTSPSDGSLRVKESVHATQTEARAVNRQRIKELESKGRTPIGKTTCVSDYVDDWLNRSVKARCSPNTYSRRLSALRIHICTDPIAQMEIGKVRPRDLDDFQDRLRSKKCQSPTLANVRQTLGAAFQDAVRREIIYDNPVRLSQPPETQDSKTRFFDDKEARTLLTHLQGHALEALVTTALFSGLRLSEAIGLTWDKIDFERQTMTIDQQLQRVADEDPVNAGFALKRLKTPRSQSTIPMSPQVVTVLKSLKAQRLVEGDLSDEVIPGLVFRSPSGGPWHRKNVLVAVNRVYKQAGIPQYGFHVLRHTCASILINNGASALEVQRHLRHANVRTTLDVYAHLFPEKLQGNIDILSRVLTLAAD